MSPCWQRLRSWRKRMHFASRLRSSRRKTRICWSVVYQPSWQMRSQSILIERKRRTNKSMSATSSYFSKKPTWNNWWRSWKIAWSSRSKYLRFSFFILSCSALKTLKREASRIFWSVKKSSKSTSKRTEVDSQKTTEWAKNFAKIKDKFAWNSELWQRRSESTANLERFPWERRCVSTTRTQIQTQASVVPRKVQQERQTLTLITHPRMEEPKVNLRKSASLKNC